MDTWAHVEMMGANVHDARRRDSLAEMLNSVSEKPGVSFSAAVGPAKRQAFHRLCAIKTEDENEVPIVLISDLLSGHFEQTLSRVKEECRGGLVLAIQDTSHFNFNGLKMTVGLGYGNSTKDRCLFGHSALALTVEGLPLGILDLQVYARNEADFGKSGERRNLDYTQKESYRWVETLRRVEAQLPEDQPVLFVQDREADIFAFLEAPTRANTYLLVRASQPRRVEVEVPGETDWKKGTLFNMACCAPTVGRMKVTIPRAPNRTAKDIDLVVQAVSVRIMPPKDRKGVGDQPVTAWVVRARELSPPEGEKAIEWVLITTMPITSSEDACQMVAFYAKRWVIERLHYTIKSGGCNAERLQMDDAHSIMLALALYYVNAWRQLYITYLARVQPDAPAAMILSDTEIEVLEAIGKRAVKTIFAAVIEIAKLGGYEYYKNGPPPGVKRLWIGLRRLEDMQAGWLLARQGLPLPTGLRYDT